MNDYKPKTSYADAVKKLDLVLCNNIPQVDESIWDNARFSLYYEDEKGNETDDMIEIYQYYFTDASLSTIEYLENRYGLLFTYSDKLDVFILCVTHFGTSWDYIPVQDNEAETIA